MKCKTFGYSCDAKVPYKKESAGKGPQNHAFEGRNTQNHQSRHGQHYTGGVQDGNIPGTIPEKEHMNDKGRERSLEQGWKRRKMVQVKQNATLVVKRVILKSVFLGN